MSNVPRLEFDGLGCHSLLQPLLLQSESCGWKNFLGYPPSTKCHATTKSVRHEIMAVHPETEIRGLGHLPSSSNMPAGSELRKAETLLCQCEENSPCEKDLFSKPLSEDVSTREMNESPLQRPQLPGGGHAHNSQD